MEITGKIFFLLCCFKIQGSRFDPQLVLPSAVLINLEVVIIMNEYCSFLLIVCVFLLVGGAVLQVARYRSYFLSVCR